ncbi:hypothetical protein J5J86_14090 [Aquabacter sp. L1I39]|uniref:hypothetical protein n=1 Tax=Aquabacter sp. L1I39 TaxID=2820278 RepID=UPI001ADB18FF|nr:hypothetical protein [Aquabacter sp. L1I39]QTL01936.1 hypothetical protein J5J86_14090 [Aquabacter sp. L1I39]
MTISYSAQGPGALHFAVGDVVRCVDTCGMPKDSPLIRGHIYTVRAIEGDEAAPAALRFPLVHLHGIEGGYGAFRFVKVEEAPPAAPQADPLPVRMAQVMREKAAETGACDAHDLLAAGFSQAEIIAYGYEATLIAHGAPAQPTEQVAA